MEPIEEEKKVEVAFALPNPAVSILDQEETKVAVPAVVEATVTLGAVDARFKQQSIFQYLTKQ